MEILSWNCRGIGNDSSVQALLTLVQQKHPAMIFLSETKVRNSDYMNRLRYRLGYLNCEAVFSDGQSGGLALSSVMWISVSSPNLIIILMWKFRLMMALFFFGALLVLWSSNDSRALPHLEFASLFG